MKWIRLRDDAADYDLGDSDMGLAWGKPYLVLEEGRDWFVIINDEGNTWTAYKRNWKEVTDEVGSENAEH